MGGAPPHPDALRRPRARLRPFVRASLKELTGFAIRRSGVAALVRNTYGRRRVAVLSYHDPAPEVVEKHLAYLSRRHRFITLDELAAALGGPGWDALPDRSIVVTLDDGHAGNARLLDVFRRFGVVPTIYLCSGIVATGRRYWWTCEGIDAQRLKTVPNHARLATLAKHGFSETADAADAERQALGRDEIARMLGHVDFGSHTRFHPILPQCTDAGAADEIAASKPEVEALTGRECRHFSFPNGDHGDRDVEAARAAGYATARTLEPGWNDRDTDPCRLKLLGCADGASINELAALMAGIRVARRAAGRLRMTVAPVRALAARRRTLGAT